VKANAEVRHDDSDSARVGRHAAVENGRDLGGRPATAQSLLRLQRSAGNRAVARLAAGGTAALAVQREVTSTFRDPTSGERVDFTQLSSGDIASWINELRKPTAAVPEKDAQIALMENYLLKRDAAFDELDNFRRSAPAQSPHFNGIGRDAVASHLARTIERPHLINQGQMAWCGPNTFLMVIARNDPVAYAHYVTETFASGRGMLGEMDVKPGDKVKGEWTDKKIKQPADWIALGSLRDAGNWFWSATDETIGFATFPGDITSWFSKYGLPRDKIVQKGGFIASTDAAELADANNRLAAGWNVLLWVHMFTLGSGGKPEDITKFDIQKTHWVVMDSPFVQSGDRWKCDVNTWGGKARNEVEMLDSKISSSVFGFIAVDMKEQLRKPAADASSTAPTGVPVGTA
jgi:hypothetical protein